MRLKYVLGGNATRVNFTVYGGLSDYLANLPRPESQLSYIDYKLQEPYLKDLVELIKNQSTEQDVRARIAISMVQHIPYDTVAAETGGLHEKYPYEVLYQNKGICGEKSRLLAFLLKELGFGVALLHYVPERHMAVGIECSKSYSLNGTKYCFVETTTPSIITDDRENYTDIGWLNSTPLVIEVFDGRILGGVSKEYADANELQQLNALPGMQYYGGGATHWLSKSDYRAWYHIVWYYDIQTPDPWSSID